MENKNYSLTYKTVFLSAMFLPIIAYVIAQFVLGFFNIVSIVVLGVIGYIIYINFAHSKQHKKKTLSSNTQDEEEQDVQSRINQTDRREVYRYDETRAKALFRGKVASLVMVAVMIGLSIITYYSFVKKVGTSNATLVNATVIKVEDKTTRTVEYEDDTRVEKVNNKCEVTFSYLIDEDEHTLVHNFGGISTFEAKQIKIYVSDNEFVATENLYIWGKVFVIYFVILAVINFVKAISGSEILVVLIGNLFSAVALVFMMALQVCLKQIFFLEFGAIIVMLTIVGLGMLIFFTPDKINNN